MPSTPRNSSLAWTSTPSSETAKPAATRALEIVSEAARRLPEELRARHPDLPWRAIMGSGNIYRHNYDNVAHHAVWHTIHAELPALAAVIAEEIAKLS